MAKCLAEHCATEKFSGKIITISSRTWLSWQEKKRGKGQPPPPLLPSPDAAPGRGYLDGSYGVYVVYVVVTGSTPRKSQIALRDSYRMVTCRCGPGKSENVFMSGAKVSCLFTYRKDVIMFTSEGFVWFMLCVSYYHETRVFAWLKFNDSWSIWYLTNVLLQFQVYDYRRGKCTKWSPTYVFKCANCFCWGVFFPLPI